MPAPSGVTGAYGKGVGAGLKGAGVITDHLSRNGTRPAPPDTKTPAWERDVTTGTPFIEACAPAGDDDPNACCVEPAIAEPWGDAVLGSLVSAAEEALSADRATLYLQSPSGAIARVWTTEADVRLRRRIEAAVGRSMDELPIWRAMVAAGPIMAVEDRDLLDPEVAHVAGLIRARAFIATSITDDREGADGRSVGSLFCSFAAPRRFSAAERDRLRSMGRLAAAIVGGARHQEQALEALLHAEERVVAAQGAEFLIDGSADLSARSDVDRTIRQVSAASLAVLGVNPRDAEGRRLEELLGEPLGGARFEDLAERVLASADGVATIVSRRTGRDGEPLVLETSARVQRDGATGAPVEIHTASRDVTRQVREQESLRRERDYAQALVESIQDGLAVLSPDGKLILVNDRLCEMTGFARDALLGATSPFPFWPADRADGIRAEIERLLEEGGGEVDLAFCRANGGRFPAILSVTVLRDATGRGAGCVATVKDVSDRRRAEDQLRRQAAEEVALRRVATAFARDPDDQGRLFALVAREAAGFLGSDSGVVVRFEPGGCGRVVGSHSADPGDVLPVGEDFDLEGSRGACALVHATGGPARVERWQVEDGRVALWALSQGLKAAVAAPIVVEGTPWGAVAVSTMRDEPFSLDAEERLAHFADHVSLTITTAQERAERQRLAMSLRRSQKLEAVGQLAAGVAHEINTPIQFVSDSLHFLADACGGMVALYPLYRALIEEAAVAGGIDLDRLADLRRLEDEHDLEYGIERVPPAVDRARDGARRVAEIVRAMKEFAHPSHEELQLADLNRAIENTLIVAQNEIKHSAEVALDLGEIPPVECHVGDLSRAILNIVVNAAHAIEQSRRPRGGGMGSIRVATRLEGDRVDVTIADDGCGIPAEIRDRIFEPFFTTKDVGEGTGQGLSIAHAIVVEGHGGSLTAESEDGQGTTFRITLPLRSSEGAT